MTFKPPNHMHVRFGRLCWRLTFHTEDIFLGLKIKFFCFDTNNEYYVSMLLTFKILFHSIFTLVSRAL